MKVTQLSNTSGSKFYPGNFHISCGLVFLFLLSSCLTNSPLVSSRTTDQILIETILNGPEGADLGLCARPVVEHFYRQRDYRPLWLDEGRVSARGRELIGILSDCEEYGLFPTDFHRYEICSLDPGSGILSDAARVDILLTDCFFLFIHQVYHGTLDVTSLSTHRFTQSDTSLISLIKPNWSDSTIREQIAGCEPDHYFYREFKRNLKTLLQQRDSFPDDETVLDSINELYVNMERWRWQFQDFPQRYLFLNLASGRLYLFNGCSPVFSIDAIVGKHFHPVGETNAVAECLRITETGQAEITFVTPPHDYAGSFAASLFVDPASDDAETTWIQETLCISNGTHLAKLLDCNYGYTPDAEWWLEQPLPLYIRYYTIDQGQIFPDLQNIHEDLLPAMLNPPFYIEE